ncbi:hypothetical protein vseg_012152 [Gypsophila vaccaria]
MEEKKRISGSNSGVVKNRSSSGCLVIKKKAEAGSSSDRKVYESNKAKKRARVSGGDTVSSDEELLEYYRTQGGGGGGGVGGSGSGYYDDFGGGGFGGNGVMRRNELDVYDFDEYDDLSDVEMMGARYFYDRDMGGGGSERRGFSPGVEMKSGGGGVAFEGGSSKGDIIYKRRKSSHGSTGGGYFADKRRFLMNKELPIAMGKERFGGSDDAIRLQGKNGVLKVRVKNNAEVAEQRTQMYRPMEVNNVIHRGQKLTAKSIVIQRHSPYSERKLPKKLVTGGRVDKRPMDKPKSWAAKSSEESDEESDEDDSSAKLRSDSVKAHEPVKRGRKPVSLQSPEMPQPVKAREGKVRRGSGTEKQLLREKIKSMLISAGWTIDYRPRRGRDYSDAVYVNPTGTAFWSIIKAYDAFQKQIEEEGQCLRADDSAPLAPIPEDSLSKLTRQTRKKIEKELKRKKREEGGAKKRRTNKKVEVDESDADSSGSGRPDEKIRSYTKHSSNTKLQERGDDLGSISSSKFIHARKSNKIGRCTLLVRNSEKGPDSGNDGFVPYAGKRNLLSWLIDSGTVELSEKVQYMNRRHTRVMLEGWITRDGIHCGCCSKILTVSKFEIHAASKLRQPFQNIYLSSGPSLLQCQADTWNKQPESLRNGFNEIDVDGDDPNDDTCAICGDGGNLICCDSCPSTFHQNCLDIQMLPPGDWHCQHCSCKFCALANVSSAEGYDTKENLLLTCSLCERRYHSSCMEADESSNSNTSLSFCGKSCHEVYEKLQKLLGLKHELEDGLCWSLIQRTDLGSDNSVGNFPQRVEWNSKLAVAQSIMDECFLPITDRRSGINIIHYVLYNCGSNFTRLNYNGFYTAILERSDEIISAASIRIHGTQLAEMPFIGTRHIYRRQGMCRRLFSAIESALCSLNVKKLIIPAISELMDTWTGVFGFNSLEESDKREMKMMNMLVFPGTDMLQKKLTYRDGFVKDLAGVDSTDAAHNASDLPDMSQTSDLDSSPGPFNAIAAEDGEKITDKSSNDISSQDLVVSVHGTSETSPHQHVSEEVKPSSITTSANSPREAVPVVPGEGNEGIAHSLQLDIKLDQPAEDLNDHITSSSGEEIDNNGKTLNTSAETHEVSIDCKLTQGTCNTDTVMDDRFPTNDETQNDNPLSPKDECGKEQSMSTTFQDVITSSSKEDIDITVNTVENSGETHELSADCKVVQETCNTDTEIMDVEYLKNAETKNDDVITSSSKAGIDITGNTLENSAVTHELPADCKVMQESCNTDTEIMDVEYLKNAETENDDPSSPNAVCIPGGEDRSILATPHDFISSNGGSPIVPCERSQGTTDCPVQSDIKLEEAVEDLEVHIASKSEEIDAAESVLQSSTEKHEVSANCKSTQEVCKTDAEIANGLHGDFKANNDGSVSPNRTASGKPQSISEESHDDISFIEATYQKSSIEAMSEAANEGSQETTNSSLPLDMKLKESAEELKDLITSTSEIIAGNGLDHSAEKNEVSADCNLTPEICQTGAKVLGNGSPRNDPVQNDNSLSSNTGSASGDEHQSTSETSHNDISFSEVMPVIPDEGSQGIKNSHPQPDINLKEFAKDLRGCNTSLASEDISGAGKTLDNSAKKEEVSADCNLTQEVCETETELIGCGSPWNNKTHNDETLFPTSGSVADGEHRAISETSHDDKAIEQSSAAVDNVGNTAEVNVLGTHSVPDVVDTLSEMPSSNISEQLSIPDDNGICRSPQTESHDTFGAVKPKLDSCDGDSSQTISDSELKTAENITTAVANNKSISEITSETAGSPEVTPVSADGGTTDAVVLSVCENDDQSSK